MANGALRPRLQQHSNNEIDSTHITLLLVLLRRIVAFLAQIASSLSLRLHRVPPQQLKSQLSVKKSSGSSYLVEMTSVLVEMTENLVIFRRSTSPIN
jgi:hypothetical protein